MVKIFKRRESLIQEENRVGDKLNVNEILNMAVEKDASDIHLKAGASPIFRIHRELHSEARVGALTPEDIRGFFDQITNDRQKQIFRDSMELDFSYAYPQVGRFRVNAFMQIGTISLVFRWVRKQIPDIEDLGLPPICRELALRRDGLVILTGPTGCGKSTTLAGMLNYMNQTVKRNIITIEDPIEFLHEDGKCTFSQREVGVDTETFASGLKHIFRQDPDVILIGEMRDLETMSIALTAAETGHLVLTTLHTPSSYEAIDRFVDVFPAEQHQQVRLQLSTTLQAILYQSLIPMSNKEGVVPAVEVLIATPAIRNLIREGKSYQMLNFMHSGQDTGMQTLEQALTDLFRAGKISQKEALARLRSLDYPETGNGDQGRPKTGLELKYGLK
jgi:twitching motility protein PilT